MEQIISISGRTGIIGSFDGKESNVPFFEKFYLEGPYNLRGWDYREVGPKDYLEPMGGKSFSYASLEYTFKIADPLRFAFFYDGGFCVTRTLSYWLEVETKVGTTIGGWVFVLWLWGCLCDWILVSLFPTLAIQVGPPNFTFLVAQGFKVLLPSP